MMPQTHAAIPSRGENVRAAALTELANLDYSSGTITVFAIQSNKATVKAQFTPGHGYAQGIAMDHQGLIYTTLSPPGSKPCAACVAVFTDTGKPVAQLPAPILPGAPGAPSLTDVSVDAQHNVYVSDFGQQAVYFYSGLRQTGAAPTVIVRQSQNAASVLATPDGVNVLVSGGCGFASVRPYTLVTRGHYQQGSCFGIGTIALIGGAADNSEDVLTPVDGIFGVVSVSSPSGGTLFNTPDPYAAVGGVALNHDASVAYVVNAHKQCVYAFARPAKGWLLGGQPKVIATYKGFKNLDIIAVP
ncbi:MAG: hypothetical protein JO263_02065 [Candidatus Eremiobacteraeota bacterium]|nr:hypothetical protein [Candidatus Eremiobacteraeota bacterium]